MTGMSQIAKEGDDMKPLKLNEMELRQYKDNLYEKSGQGKSFNGLLEVIACRENIIHAINKLKANSGFNTPGVDGITGEDLLQYESDEFFDIIQHQFECYSPKEVRKVYIPKSDGKTRQLGISTIVDRVIQTAISNIIEPIAEAKFYKHSYGFRPMRQIEHAYGYLSTLVNSCHYQWIVEGDIKGYFDNIDHNIMIDKLYKIGVQDKRVLMLIKKIMKAGVAGENHENNIGIPQGSPLSPLLANIYLNDFDKWVSEQWLEFETRGKYATNAGKIRAQKQSKLKVGYLIRYADDWIIVTDSKESAEKWKISCKKYLRDKLHIELSDEKTKITNLSENKITFLGIASYSACGARGYYTLRSTPDAERLKEKMKSVYCALKDIRHSSNDAELVENIFRYNSIIRGINNFYQITTQYNVVLNKEEWKMRGALQRTIRKTKAKRIQCVKCDNLQYYKNLHIGGTTLGFEVFDRTIGLEKLGVGKYRKPMIKAQWINPYNEIGRLKYEEITGKQWFAPTRNPWLTLENISSLLAKNSNKIYNLEYFLNRPVVFNRDKGKCRVCGKELSGIGDTNIHHKDRSLSIDKINKVSNLITCCLDCHYKEHNKKKTTKKSAKINQTPIKRSSKKPDAEILLEQIQSMSMLQIGKLYGVSDNAVRKWARSYGIYDKRKNQHKTTNIQ